MSDLVYYILSALLSALVLLGLAMQSRVKSAVRGNLICVGVMGLAILLTLYKDAALAKPLLWASMARHGGRRGDRPHLGGEGQDDRNAADRRCSQRHRRSGQRPRRRDRAHEGGRHRLRRGHRGARARHRRGDLHGQPDRRLEARPQDRQPSQEDKGTGRDLRAAASRLSCRRRVRGSRQPHARAHRLRSRGAGLRLALRPARRRRGYACCDLSSELFLGCCGRDRGRSCAAR